MRKLAAVALASVATAGLAGPAVAGAAVTWKDNYKKSISVRKGQKVKFVWGDNKPHNMYGAAKAGSAKRRGHAVIKSFKRSGTIRCSYHPNMWIKVRVR